MRKFADKDKICNTKEDYDALMKTLEKLGFHWYMGQNPTDPQVFDNSIQSFPVKLNFGFWGDGSKRITYTYRF